MAVRGKQSGRSNVETGLAGVGVLPIVLQAINKSIQKWVCALDQHQTDLPRGCTRFVSCSSCDRRIAASCCHDATLATAQVWGGKCVTAAKINFSPVLFPPET